MVVDVRPLGAAGRLGGLRGHDRASRRVAAPAPPHVHRPRRGPRGRRARHQPAARRRASLHGSLPRLSDRLGELVRTNSEAILAVTLPPGAPDIQRRVAITGSIYPDPDTHIETVVYGDAADSMSALYTVLVGDGTRVTRPLKLARRRRPPPAHVPEAVRPARLVAPHDHRARDADARQRDRAAGHAHAAAACGCRPSRTPSGRSRPSSRSPTTSPPGSPAAPAASRRRR